MGTHRRRHAAPSTRSITRPIITAAGVFTTGSLSLAGVADAAPAVNWSAVAECESSGDWSINTGNGFSGGLQFTDSTWHAFGGSTAHAYQASESEQVAVAERVLAGQGIGAWPVCGSKGATSASAAHPSRVVPVPARTVAPARTRQAAVPTPTPAPAPAALSSRLASPSAARTPSSRSYRVLPGDTLGSIAAAHRVPGGWQAIARANAAITDPNLIFPGQTLTLPGVSASAAVATPPRVTAAPSPTVTPAVAPTVSATPVVGATTSSSVRQRVIATARTWLGDPYRYGGTSHSGVDCSGLVQQVLRANGISVPRTADQQYRSVVHITRSAAQPGDLVYYLTPGGTAYHTGFYLGGGQFLDAPDTGQVVKVQSLSSTATVAFGRLP